MDQHVGHSAAELQLLMQAEQLGLEPPHLILQAARLSVSSLRQFHVLIVHLEARLSAVILQEEVNLPVNRTLYGPHDRRAVRNVRVLDSRDVAIAAEAIAS